MTQPDFRALCAELLQEFSSLYSDMSARIDFNDIYIERMDNLFDRAASALIQPEPEGVRQEAILDWLRNDEAWGTTVAPKSWRAQDDKLLNLLLRAIAHFGRPTLQPVPVVPSDDVKGLHGKFIIHKANGEPVKYPCFVLRIDGKDAAAISAFRAYAIATEDTKLRQDILELISPLTQPEPEGATEDDMDDLADDLLGIVLPEGSGARLITRALELWGRPTIQPVPVAERLPEAGDCDAEGRCWLHRPAEILCRLANGTLYRWVLDTPCRDEEGPIHDTHWLPAHALPIPTSQEVLGDDH